MTTKPPRFRSACKSEPASFYARYGALLIDGGIIGLGAQAVTAVISPASPFAMSYLLPVLIGIPYFGFFYSLKGATPGKACFGLSVYKTETTQAPSFFRSVAREYIGKPISILTLLIGYLIAAFRTDRRALHDLIAGTEVMKTGPTDARFVTIGLIAFLLNSGMTGMMVHKQINAELNSRVANIEKNLEQEARTPASTSTDPK